MRRTVIHVLAALVLSAPVAARGQVEQKVDDKASAGADKKRIYTVNEFRREALEFNRRTLSGAYKEFGRRGAWDDDAVKFLDRFAEFLTYSPKGSLRPASMPRPDELVEGGRKLVAAGCDDPLVGYALVVGLAETGHAAEATELLTKVLPAINATGYPDFRVRAAAGRLVRLAPDTPAGFAARGIEYDRTSNLLFVQGVSDFERRLWVDDVWAYVERMHSREEQVHYLGRLRARDGGDPWMLDVLEGRLLIKRGWDARGYGYVDTVTDEGWAAFRKDLAQARDLLTRAWKARPNLPHAPTEMITVSMGAGELLGEDPRDWFARATAAQLDFDPAYAAIREALMPRWGGSHEAVLKIGFDAAATGRYDTALPWQFGESVRLIAPDVGGWETALAMPGVYEQLVEVADGYAAFLAPRRGDSLGYYRTLPAALAWRTGRYPEARRLLEALGGEVDLKPFALVGAQHPPAAIGNAWVMGGPEAARATRAEDAMKAGDLQEALDAFRALAQATADQPQAKPYLDARVEVLDRRLRYASGDWVDLQPVGRPVGWRQLDGQWEVRPDGSLAGLANPGGKQQHLICDDDFGDRFEISARLVDLPPTLFPGFAFTRGGQLDGEVLVGYSGVTLLERTGSRGLRASSPGRWTSRSYVTAASSTSASASGSGSASPSTPPAAETSASASAPTGRGPSASPA